jgi:hypothetical protein
LRSGYTASYGPSWWYCRMLTLSNWSIMSGLTRFFRYRLLPPLPWRCACVFRRCTFCCCLKVSRNSFRLCSMDEAGDELDRWRSSDEPRERELIRLRKGFLSSGNACVAGLSISDVIQIRAAIFRYLDRSPGAAVCGRICRIPDGFQTAGRRTKEKVTRAFFRHCLVHDVDAYCVPLRVFAMTSLCPAL